jgi:hypothetical protein
MLRANSQLADRLADREINGERQHADDLIASHRLAASGVHGPIPKRCTSDARIAARPSAQFAFFAQSDPRDDTAVSGKPVSCSTARRVGHRRHIVELRHLSRLGGEPNADG